MINFDEVIDVEAIPKEHSEHPNQQQGAISGKVAVASFSLILLLGFVAVLSIALQFQSIMQRLNASRSAWGAASTELSSRFAEAEKYLSSVNYLDGSPTLLDWTYYYSQFSESRQFDRQVISASKLEGMLEAILSQKSLPPTAPITPLKPQNGLLELLEQEQLRKQTETSFLGSWTKTLLRLNTPLYFESISK